MLGATVFAMTLLTAPLRVQVNDVAVTLNTFDMPMLFAGETFSAQDLADANATLLAAGIQTPGHFCLFAAETAQGTSVILLLDGVDEPLPGDQPKLSLGVESLHQGSGTTFINNDSGGWWYEYQLPEGVLGTGTVQWIHGQSYAALAWTGFEDDTLIDLSLFDVGLADVLEVPVLLLLSAESTGFSVAHEVDFGENGSIDLLMDLAPVPAPGLPAMLLVLVPRRRRR